MKGLLRKLHIGCSVDAGRPLDGRSPGDGSGENRNTLIPSPSSSATARVGGGPGTGTGTGTGTLAGTGSGEGDEDAAMDFNYFEEEYQVQLALAISASSSIPEEERRMVNDPESLQIQAAKRISLGHFPSPSPATSPVEFLAHRYWFTEDNFTDTSPTDQGNSPNPCFQKCDVRIFDHCSSPEDNFTAASPTDQGHSPTPGFQNRDVRVLFLQEMD